MVSAIMVVENMKNENHSKFTGLVGKTISRVHLSNSHGDIVQIKFSDRTRLHICSYQGTMEQKNHGLEELYVSVDGEEL
jgi:hypothetical protein